MGTITYPLTQQIADTVKAHGRSWALWHYCINRRGPKLSRFEWVCLSRGAHSFA